MLPLSSFISRYRSRPLTVAPPLRSPEGVGLHSVFSWVGQTFYKLQLKPQDALCVRLQACFFQAGVYNLNTPQVFAKPSDQGAEFETSQQAASPALIIISNA